jgi:hypothetical protein
MMRPEYDFSEGVRGKHVGKHLRIIGDTSVGRMRTAVLRNGNTLVGTAGEYYVCAELCRLGYLALLTPKNNPLFDVVATNVDGTTSVSIQVKTRSARNKQGWKLNKKLSAVETPGVPFVVLVNLNEQGPPDFLVYPYSEFASRVREVFDKYMARPKRTGEPHKDPGFRWFDEVNFTNADRAKLNNWEPIVSALENNGSRSGHRTKKRGV